MAHGRAGGEFGRLMQTVRGLAWFGSAVLPEAMG